MNIIVTGASSGIGYQTVLELAKSGEHHIVVISRNEEKLETLKTNAESISDSKISIIGFDIGSGDFKVLHEQLDFCFNFTDNNTVDVLINNAGYLVNKPFVDITESDWQKTFDVNLFGSVKLIQLLFPHFNRSRAAHIVNIASMGGVQGTIKFPGLAAYSASKGALNILTESLAAEFHDENIKVNSINPGAVQTEMLKKAFPDYDAPVTPQQMGSYIANFALTGSSLMNGRLMEVSLSG